jgi:predicted transcriptional regulator
MKTSDTTFTFRLSDDLKAAIIRLAEVNNLSSASLVRKLVENCSINSDPEYKALQQKNKNIFKNTDLLLM